MNIRHTLAAALCALALAPVAHADRSSVAGVERANVNTSNNPPLDAKPRNNGVLYFVF